MQLLQVLEKRARLKSLKALSKEFNYLPSVEGRLLSGIFPEGIPTSVQRQDLSGGRTIGGEFTVITINQQVFKAWPRAVGQWNGFMVISGSFTRDSRCLGEEFLGKNSGRFLRKKVCAAARWSVKSILRGAQLERELRLEGNCLELFLNKDNRRP